MPKVDKYNMQGEVVGQQELSDAIFAVPMNEALVHQVIVAQLANKRQGTQSALTRAEVRGGGRKPWRQKGTGRARQGSTRAPQWTHGGVVFAPKPRDYSKAVPRKMRRAALRCALSSKVEAGELLVLDDLKLENAKTREMVALLKLLGCEKKSLVVLPGKDEFVSRASGNIQGLKLAYVNTLNTYDVLKYDKLVLISGAVPQIEEVYA
ncbi:MAG: 50S ribosomal protein L4 [Christensenellaceae bacterium]|jgi:large subunit ribosomal protein L4|nr:50S ribosomal protein L4 [Christensenellaceae bacterium]